MMIFKLVDSEASVPNSEGVSMVGHDGVGVPMVGHDGVGMAVSSLALVTVATMATLFTF